MYTKFQIVQVRKAITILLSIFGIVLSALGADNTASVRAQGVMTETPTQEVTPLPTIPQVVQSNPMIVDSRFRYESLLGGFDIQSFLESRSSGLATFVVSPKNKAAERASDIIDEVARKYGISPKVLLVLIQLQSGIVDTTEVSPEQFERPMGLSIAAAKGFRGQLESVARKLALNAPQYSEEHDIEVQEVTLPDGRTVSIGGGKNPTSALLSLAAETSSVGQTPEMLTDSLTTFSDRFVSLYEEYYSVSPLSFTSELTAALSGARLPFAGTKRYTGGPHGGGTTTVCATILVTDGSGIDFSRNTSTDPESWEVLSMLPGTLLSRDTNMSGGIGNRIRIQYSTSLVVEYWHLASFSTEIQNKNIGDSIPQGFPIGYSGNSGNQPSIHLHVELRTPSGTRIPWDGEIIDGYTIGFHKVYSNQSYGYNYQGSAVLGSTKRQQITAYCGGTGANNYALVGLNYNNSNEQNGVDPNTIFADTRFDSNAGRVTSTNTRNTGISVCNNPSPNSDQIGLYSDDNYCGTAKILGIGNYSNASNMGFPNDALSSIKVGSNVKTTLCKDDNYLGGCEVFTSDDPHLGDNGIGNDSVSSIQVVSKVVSCDVPSGQFCGEYYNNRTLSGSPTFTRNDSSINFDWGSGGPDNGVGSDNFSIRWQGTFSFESATYTFSATADDGIRVWVDNVLKIDAWIDQGPTTYQADVPLSSGNHTVKVEYYENGGGAVAKASWVKKGSVYNTAFLTDAQLTNYASMSVDQIRSFLINKGSYFRQSVQDADGVTFDPPQVIAQAAAQYQINPQVILVTLQKESSAVTSGSSGNKATLLGCNTTAALPAPLNTARGQFWCAAERFRAYQNQLNSSGSTVSGWKVGVAKTTQDGVAVTPATKAVAGQFTYTPYAGVQWGGNQSTVGGVYLFYYWWQQFGF